MINNIDITGPIFHGPHVDALQEEYGPPADIVEMFYNMEKALLLNYQKTKDFLWKLALTAANGGTMPDMDEIKRRSTQIVDTDGTTHLLWDHPPIKPGGLVNMSYCIASLKKPNL